MNSATVRASGNAAPIYISADYTRYQQITEAVAPRPVFNADAALNERMRMPPADVEKLPLPIQREGASRAR